MDEQIPWTGGISNRQILLDSLRGLTIWAAIAFSLLALGWWITGSFANSAWRAAVCAAFAGSLSYPVARWCRASAGPEA